jgi:hypothetical protein
MLMRPMFRPTISAVEQLISQCKSTLNKIGALSLLTQMTTLKIARFSSI